MHRAISCTRSVPRPKSVAEASDSAAPNHAVEEINVYIAIRNDLLVEAEKKPTGLNLKRVGIANEVVASCLKPARSRLYQAQFLPQTDAVRERQRCTSASARIAELRQRVA
jgi:hypothetical protein